MNGLPQTVQRYPSDYLADLSDSRVLMLAAQNGLLDRLEDEFRVWAFNIAWQRSYAEIRDPAIRFVRSLLDSTREVKNPERELQWKAAKARAWMTAKPKHERTANHAA